MRLWNFCVSNSRDVSLHAEHDLLPGSVKPGRVNIASQVGEEHPVALKIQRDANSLHQVSDQNLGRDLARFRIRWRAVHSIAARRIATVRPIEDAIFDIELQIYR